MILKKRRSKAMNNNQPKEIKVGLDKLFLDTRNPRFASYFNRNGSQTTEDSAISHLIDNASVIDLAESIMNFGGLYYGESIHCIKKEGSADEFIVLEGNRRISACKLLKPFIVITPQCGSLTT